jgi:hypothetical protein
MIDLTNAKNITCIYNETVNSEKRLDVVDPINALSANNLIVQPEGDIRFTVDGTVATATVGFIIPANTIQTFKGAGFLVDLSFASVSGQIVNVNFILYD